MREPLFSTRALQDFDEILEFIERDAPQAGRRVIESIRDTCGRLAEFPYLGRSRNDIRPNFRSFPVANYMIFYEPLADTVRIARVIHGALDVSRGMLDE